MNTIICIGLRFNLVRSGCPKMYNLEEVLL